MEGSRWASDLAAALKDQVVLLVFDRTRREGTRFSLETIYRAFRSNGLNAIYVVPALYRTEGAADRYTVPVVVDKEGVVAKRFGITWNGTVLINREAKVVYLDAYQNAEELAAALHKLEIW